MPQTTIRQLLADPTGMPPLPVRQYWVDALRAICISLVIFYHASGYQYPSVARHLSAFPIPLFIFLSGFQLSKRVLNASFRDFVSKSLRTIVVSYFSFGLLTYFIWLLKNQLVAGAGYEAVGPVMPLFGMIYGASGNQQWLTHNVPLWYLTCIASVLVCYYWLYRWVRSAILAFAVSLPLVFAGNAIMQSLSVRLPWNLDLALVTVCFFALGYLFKTFRLDMLLAKRTVGLVALPVLAAINFAAVPHPNHIDLNLGAVGNPWLYLADCISAILMGVILAQQLPRWRILEPTGRNSLLIMLLHGLAITAFSLGFQAVLGERFLSFYESIWYVPASVLFTNWLCNRLGSLVRRYAPWMTGAAMTRRRKAGDPAPA